MDAVVASPPDLFDAEHRALVAAQAAHEAGTEAGTESCLQALGDLLTVYERLLRETRRLVQRSDRTELEMTRLNLRLQDLAAQLEHRATHDPLTGVLNRAAIIERVNHHFSCHHLGLIVLDIDHFKRINDSFGHPVGDRVILGVVNCLKSVVPAIAQIGRVGGEEFTVVVPRQSMEMSEQLAQTIRQAMASHAFGLPDGSSVTASFGVSWLPCGSSFDDAYSLADEALYAAKRGGRNQVVRATMPVHATHV